MNELMLRRRALMMGGKKKSKNLCDVQYFMDNYIKNPRGYYYVPIFVGTGTTVTVSIEKLLPAGLGFYLCVAYAPYETGVPATWIYHSTSGDTNRKKSYTFVSTQDYIYINVYNLAKFEANVGYLQVELNDHATEYEPHY